MFIKSMKKYQPEAVIRIRDLCTDNVSHISEKWISATTKPKVDRSVSDNDVLTASDTYIDELRDADVIVFGIPMYNWSIPSVLKAYIDNIMRVNETWRFNSGNKQQPYEGLLKGKKAMLLLSRGSIGYDEGEPNQHLDFQTNYLKMILNVIGISDIKIVSVNGTNAGPTVLKAAVAAASENIRAIVTNLQYD